MENLEYITHYDITENVISFDIIREERGKFPNGLKIVKYLYDEICKIIKNGPPTKSTNNCQTYVIKFQHNNFGPQYFFNSCNIQLVINKYIQNIKFAETSYNGQFDTYNASIVNDRLDQVNILINIDCTRLTIKQIIYGALMHELTHAYETYMRLKNNGSDSDNTMTNYFENMNINMISQLYRDYDPYLSSLGQILYASLKTEQNAFFAGLQAEYKVKKNNLKPNEKYRPKYVIKHLKNYEHIEEANRAFNRLASVKDENTQKNILDNLNKVLTRSLPRKNDPRIRDNRNKDRITNYNKLLKFLKQKLIDINNKFEKTVSRIIESAYLTNVSKMPLF